MGIYFDAAVEHVRRELGAGEAEALLKSGLVPRRLVPLLKYPVADILKLLAASGERLVRAGHAEQEALEGVGRGIAKAYLDTPPGKILILANAGNANRVLTNVPAAYKTTFTFGERHYNRLSERTGEMTFQGDLLGSTMSRGIFISGLKLSANVDAQIQVEQESADCTGFKLAMTW
jgi:uncharacterized protein (TIGR02265 family)